MKFIVFLSLILLVTANVEQDFIKFTKDFGKRYSTPEETIKRFSIFKQNLDKIRVLNEEAKGETFFGVTQFADLTEEEFSKQYLREFPKVKHEKVQKRRIRIPDKYDWRDHGAVQAVKNQGSCGSCWAFSAVGNLESQWFIKKQELLDLAEQQLVDCDHECDPEEPDNCDEGCNGGLMHLAFNYVIKNGGIEGTKTYKYTARDGKCKHEKANILATFSNYTWISDDEEEMAEELVELGPLAIAVEASSWSFYLGGIYNGRCTQNINHGVLLVGYDKTDKTPFWIIKNSWGKTWGEKGYIRLKKGIGQCAMNTYVVAASV